MYLSHYANCGHKVKWVWFFFNNFIILSVLSYHKVILIVVENLQISSIMIRLINMMNQKQECSITPREHK